MNLDDALRTLEVAASIQKAAKDAGLTPPSGSHTAVDTLVAKPVVEMDAEDVEHTRTLIAIIKKRLRKLEQKRATYGINFPPEDQIDMDNLQAEKHELEQKLQAAKAD